MPRSDRTSARGRWAASAAEQEKSYSPRRKKRMKNSLVVACAVAVTSASVALAQGGGLSTPKCQGGAQLSSQQIAQDACQQAYDIYQFLSPQLGLALAGGNATIGQGSVLGGLGHLSVGVR